MKAPRLPRRLGSLVGLVALAGAACGAAPPTVFPGDDWERASPASQGVDAAKLEAAVRWLDAHFGAGGAAELVVVRNGRLIWEGPNASSAHAVWSVTKVFTTSVLGVLVSDGRCELDTRAAAHVPGLADAHGAYADIRLRHLATMTSGYDGAGRGDGGGRPLEPVTPLFEPGEKFAYWDDAMNELAHALTRIAGEPLATVFERRIAAPIGMAGWSWGEIARVDGLPVNGGAGNLGRAVRISARESRASATST